MQISPIFSSYFIKSNAAIAVKRAFLTFSRLVFFIIFSCLFSFDLQAEVLDENLEFQGPLPSIEAKTYPVDVVARSDSNKIYLFSDLAKRIPHKGQILLMKKGSDEAMAFRVLKYYPEKSLFAAKRVRKYKKFPYLEDGSSFIAVEKISDLIPSMPPLPETAADQKELRQLEKQNGIGALPFEPALDASASRYDPQLDDEKALQFDPELDNQTKLAYDPELDSPSRSLPYDPQLDNNSREVQLYEKPATPAPAPAPAPPPIPEQQPVSSDVPINPPPSLNAPAEDAPTVKPPPSPEDLTPLELDDEQEIAAGLTVDETEVLDPNWSWLTAGFGYVRNGGPPAVGGYYYFAAGNLRYGFNLFSSFLFSQLPQDSMTLEGGFYLYKALNFNVSGDAYTIGALVGTVRYNILFSQTFGLFVYAGLLRNAVLASTQATTATLNALTNIIPAGGLGALYQIGPSWYIRADLGVESITANLVLRF